MASKTDERLVGQGMSVNRRVLGRSESVNDWSPHSRQKMKLEGDA